MKWDKVVICDIWGPGKSHLTPPLGGNLEFTLTPRFVKGKGGPHLANYAVGFVTGHAPDEWAGAIFTPMGTNAVTGINNLPAWDNSKPAVCQKYQDVINGAASELARSSTRRLETIIPYVSDAGILGYNAVRLYCVENARKAPTTHLFVIEAVAVALSAGGVRALQDGAGHGPPS